MVIKPDEQRRVVQAVRAGALTVAEVSKATGIERHRVGLLLQDTRNRQLQVIKPTVGRPYYYPRFGIRNPVDGAKKRNPRIAEIWNFIRDHPACALSEIFAAVDVPERTIRHQVDRLVAQGIVAEGRAGRKRGPLTVMRSLIHERYAASVDLSDRVDPGLDDVRAIASGLHAGLSSLLLSVSVLLEAGRVQQAGLIRQEAFDRARGNANEWAGRLDIADGWTEPSLLAAITESLDHVAPTIGLVRQTLRSVSNNTVAP